MSTHNNYLGRVLDGIEGSMMSWTNLEKCVIMCPSPQLVELMQDLLLVVTCHNHKINIVFTNFVLWLELMLSKTIGDLEEEWIKGT